MQHQVPFYLMRLPEVLTISGMSKATVYRYIKNGLFPASVPLGNGAVGWRSSDICEWLESLHETSNTRMH